MFMNILNKFNSLSTVTKGAVLGAALALPVAASVLAYGPARPTFTVERPASYPVFNSMTNNPYEGDERNFLLANEKEVLDVTDGQEVVIRAFVHNNASETLNGADFTGTGVAKDVKFTLATPNWTDQTSEKTISAYINSSNAVPMQVWDEVTLKSASNFTLEIVPGSARYQNYAKTFPS
jgi:hypothetical protein